MDEFGFVFEIKQHLLSRPDVFPLKNSSIQRANIK